MAQQWTSAPELTIDLNKTYHAQLVTSHGDIMIEFSPDRAPLAVNSFVFLARQGFYDGVIFHRVIPNFVIQGGDPTGTGRGGPGYRFRDELEGDGRYTRGTVAMANSGPNTNGSQFFICHDDVRLPHSYTLFGRVVEGMEAVDSIAALKRDPADKPLEDAVINEVTITEA